MEIEYHAPIIKPTTLHFLERLWKVMNENVRNNKFFKSAKDFRDEINRFFNVILPDIGADLGTRINDSFQKLNGSS